MLNCTKQICRCVTVREATLFLKSSNTPAPSLFGPPIIIKRYVQSPYQKKTICSNYYICLFRTFVGYFSPWFILRKVGIPCKSIISFRRGIRKFSFPWLLYSIPTALAMGLGDILAQLYGSPQKVQHVKDAKGNVIRTNHQDVTIKDLNLHRTAKFMLIGFLVVGPIRSKWNALTRRALSYNTPQMYTIKKVAIDVLILSPILLIIGLSIWDFDHIYNNYPKLNPVWEKRLKTPFWEIMKFNLMTRPFMDLVICMLVPGCFRKLVRRPYEVLFFAYVSAVLAKHKLGEKWKKPAPIIPTATKKKSKKK